MVRNFPNCCRVDFATFFKGLANSIDAIMMKTDQKLHLFQCNYLLALFQEKGQIFRMFISVLFVQLKAARI